MPPELACPGCHAPVPADATFCARCGASLTPPPGTTGERKGPGRPTRDALALDQLRQETLGEYEILGELGRGGMAVVYLAHDIALDRKVAIKLISPFLLTDETAERFKREARTAAGLSHPHVIPIFAVRETESLLFFVMKYVAGPSLEMVIRDNGPLPVPVAQAIITQTGEALGYAHRNSIVHRDVKPGNIMVDEEGWVVVTDFGIAKATAQSGLTTTGTTVGTPTHMSPEQCLAQTVTGASDQYSLGIVAYEMLTGSVPFPEDTPMAMMYAHLNRPPVPIRDVRPDCPEQLADAIGRMLEKEPEDRWPTMEDAIKAIGTPTTGPNDPVRRTMITMAEHGAAGRTMSLPSTPRSPIPSTSLTRARRVSRSESTVGTGSGAEAVATPTSSRLRRLRWAIPLLAGAGVVVVAATRLLTPAEVTVTPSSAAAPTVPPVGETAGVGEPTPQEAPPVQPAPTTAANGAATLELTPRSPRLTIGETLRFRAVVRDAAGAPQPDATVRWTSADPAIVSVAVDGLARAVGRGRTTVTAISGETRRSASVSVAPAPDAEEAPTAMVQVIPGSGSLAVGESLRLRAVLRDSAGRVLEGRAVQWESSDPRVASVSGEGVVVGVGPGVVQVRASSEERTGGAVVNVAAPAAPPPPAAAAEPASVDPTPAVRALLNRYAQAIAAERVEGIEMLFLSLPTTVRKTWQDLFDAYDEVTATLVPGTVSIGPSGETAVFDLALTLKNRRETQRVVLRSEADLRQAAGEWRFVQIRQTFASQE